MSRWAQARPWLVLVFRLILGGVLLVAGSMKLPDTGEAIRAVRAYQILPESLVPIVGYALPATEVVLGALLIVGLFVRWTALLGGLLMAIFIAGVSSAWVRGLSIDCGCFGGGGEVGAGETTYLSEILRDIGLLLAAGFLVLWPRGTFAVDNWLSGSSRAEPQDTVTPSLHLPQ